VITSLSNDKVKLARALARRRSRWQERCFVVEGVRLLAELRQCAVRPRFVFVTETTVQQDKDWVLGLDHWDVPWYRVSDEVMAACADTVTPPGVLAVVPFPEMAIPASPTWTVVVDNVRTPGNLGAILRTASAAGVDQALLSPGTVDPFNPKAVRGGAGAHFRLPIRVLGWPEIETELKGVEVWLATAGQGISYLDVDWMPPTALVVGCEAHGASQMGLALADRRVTIPMAHGVESLNVAVAVGVLLFEIARQRRARGRMRV
jgi:TrmH family RNA methyltransferase